jgi:hypothetical protein
MHSIFSGGTNQPDQRPQSKRIMAAPRPRAQVPLAIVGNGSVAFHAPAPRPARSCTPTVEAPYAAHHSGRARPLAAPVVLQPPYFEEGTRGVPEPRTQRQVRSSSVDPMMLGAARRHYAQRGAANGVAAALGAPSAPLAKAERPSTSRVGMGLRRSEAEYELHAHARRSCSSSRGASSDVLWFKAQTPAPQRAPPCADAPFDTGVNRGVYEATRASATTRQARPVLSRPVLSR